MPIPSSYETSGPYSQNIQPDHPAFDQYRKLKQAQAASIEQHKQFAQQLQVKQGQVQQRQTDLDVAGRLMKAIDPTVPKPARQFLMRELAQHVGVDPKSDTFKNLSGMFAGLDPDTLTGMRQMLSGQLKDAQPGQIVDMTRGIMTGQVSMNDFVGQVQAAGVMTQSEGQDTLEGGSGGDKVAKPFQQGEGAVRSFEGNRVIPDNAKQASPQLVGALGFDSKKQYRNEDLIKQGFRIPLDPKDQEKLATDINTQATAISGTVRETGRIVQLFQGRPETLGPVGGFIRGLQSTVRQVEGALRMANPEMVNESNPFAPELRQASKVASDQLAKIHGITATAEDSARIQAAVLGLAYRMAAAQNIPGNRLTNGIIQQQLAQIGHSSSPEQFKAVLSDTLDGTIRTYDEGIRRQVGVSGNEIIARQLSDQDIAEYAQSADILPTDFAKALHTETQNRVNGTQANSPEPSSPSIEEEQSTLGGLETERKQREIDKFNQDRDLEVKRDKRAEAASSRAEDREERMVRQNESSQTLQRERFEYEKTKDAEASQQKRMDKIGEAFRAFGHAIANSVHGISGSLGGSSGGGGQDVNAFKIAPMPERRPPAPPRGVQ